MITLADAKPRVATTEKSFIASDDKSFIVLRIGFLGRSPLARFSHPNMLRSMRTVHEFKRTRSNGSKYWTSRKGVDLYFAIDKKDVILTPECGYSYPKVTIGGATVTLNVSGGTFDGWTDLVSGIVCTSVDMPAETLHAIAGAAMSTETARHVGAMEMNFPEEAAAAA